jgi:hypothetical protein
MVFLDKDRAMDNVQQHNICINVLSSQTFRYYLSHLNIHCHIQQKAKTKREDVRDIVIGSVGSEVPTIVVMKGSIFWDVAP